MAERIQRILLCDGSHQREQEASTTLRFSFGGKAYIKDLCTEHLKDAEGAMSELTEGARRDDGTSRGPVAAPRAAAPTRTPQRYATEGMSKEQRDDIRRWARQQGIANIGRGKISGSVVDAYVEAHR